MSGNFNGYNLAQATAAATFLEVSLNESAISLKTFNGVPGRMESISPTTAATRLLSIMPVSLSL